jgi:cytochrome bd-type quinol oxidase subunit 2
VSLGANSAFALVTLISVVLAALQLAGVWTDNEPLTRWQQWSSLVVFAVLAVCFASFAFRAWRRQQQENPQ